MTRGDYCGRCGAHFKEGDDVIPTVQRVNRVHPSGIIWDTPAFPIHVTCPPPDPEPQPYDGPPRTVHTLGRHERNGLWQCVDPPTWNAFYTWQPRDPVLHDGDDSPAWHYSPAQRAAIGYWSMARSGTEDTTHETIGPLGDIDSATFVEVARHQPDGTLTYFGADGSRWQLGGQPTDES